MTLHCSRKLPNSPGVYQIYDQTINKFYVGSTTNLKRRFRRHRNDLEMQRHDNKYLQNVYNARGENLIFMFDETKDKEEALDKEQQLIDKFWKSGKLLNLAMDARKSGVGYIPSAETVEKTRRRLLNVPKSEDVRKKISQTLTGRAALPHVANMLRTNAIGRVNGSKQKEIARLVNTGKVVSEESKRKMSLAKKGRKFSVEHQAKLTLSRIGRKHSPETIAKMVLNRVKPVEIKGNVYPTARAAAEALGMSEKMIHTRINSPAYPDFIRLNRKIEQ